MTETIELQNRNLSCVIAPEFGASVVQMDIIRKDKTIPVLVPTPRELLVPGADPRLFSLAHLAPIGGRLRKNSFKWEGKVYEFEPNLPDEPLFMNGVAWQRPWVGKKDGKYSATLRFEHKKQPGWPFDFSIVAVFDLYEDNLEINYEIANEGQRGDIPFGFGSTMRIPGGPQTLVQAKVRDTWKQDEDHVPVSMMDLPFDMDIKDGFPLSKVDTGYERWYSGWAGRASVDYVEKKMSLMLRTERPFEYLGFDHQKGEDFFRFTALSHAPGMLDMVGLDDDDTGLRVLGPGEGSSAKVRIDVDMNLY